MNFWIACLTNHLGFGQSSTWFLQQFFVSVAHFGELAGLVLAEFSVCEMASSQHLTPRFLDLHYSIGRMPTLEESLSVAGISAPIVSSMSELAITRSSTPGNLHQ